MWEDPVVAEVHAIRKELAAKFNFDIKAMFADMRAREAALGDRSRVPQQQVEPPEGTTMQQDARYSPAPATQARS